MKDEMKAKLSARLGRVAELILVGPARSENIHEMTTERWLEVDRYINDLFMPFDLAMDSALEACAVAGLPPKHVSPSQGKFLFVMAKALGARRILEVGTLGGYSTMWLARALPRDGSLVTIEVNVTHAVVARANFVRAGLTDVIDIRVGPALDVLPQLSAEGCDPFDLIFIDGDKEHYSDYLAWAIKLSHVGTLIMADNIVCRGAILDVQSDDPRVQGIRRFNAALASDPRVSATEIQTVGGKGYDGFAAIVVTANP